MNRHPLLPLAALIAGAVVLTGCETVVVRKAEDIVQRVMVKVRSKGERQLAEPAEVAREMGCASSGAATARIESSETLPLRVKPGSELNHRLVVATCPGPTSEALTGTLTRRFVHQGRTLFQDSEPYTLKPGRWSVNVFVGIPPQTVAGAYRLELRFEKPGLALERSTDFTVL
jgi:hypothetical protein